MKILHVAQEHDAAMAAARAVHGIAQDAALVWAKTPALALEWLEGNRDADAVILEVQAQSGASFIRDLRARDLMTPVVVTGSARPEIVIEAFEAGASGYVPSGPSREADLTRVVGAAIERERSRAHGLAETAAERARQTRICTGLQQRMHELEGALRAAEERRVAETVALANQLAARHAEFTADLARTAQSRDALTAELNAAADALEEERLARRADAAAAVEQLHRRDTELRAHLAEAASTRAALEAAIEEAEAAHRDTRDRAAGDRTAAVERQASLEALIGLETERAAGLARKLAASEAASQDAARQHTVELAEAAAAFAQIQSRYDAVHDANAALERRMASAEAAASARKNELLEQLASERNAKAALKRQMIDGSAAAKARDVELTGDLAETRMRLERERESLARLQSAFQTLEQTAAEHASERARLETVVADRDGRLTAQAESHRLAERNAQDVLAHLQTELAQAIDAHASEASRLQLRIEGLQRELGAARNHATALRTVADRVPDLESALDRSRHESRGRFERAPHAICRCSPDGAIAEANHAFLALLGFRRAADARNVNFVTAALDSAGDLGWLLQRARITRRKETVETNWKTRDGRRLVVRLHAAAPADGPIEIVAEDITAVRALEERLRQSQRMEAVGRLASEVAMTCDGLLNDVARGGHEWLARAGSDTALRRHVETLLADVTKASSVLQQLGEYGHEQMRALEPVSTQRVLRDMAPVLQRVVGDRIEVVLPKAGGAFNVDVQPDRLERILINVAGYARTRMPSGGQVRIDLANTAVGRRFAERYSSVRPGDHVLITVTEMSMPRVDDEGDRNLPASNGPGVDLGVLVELIASCGGHLWLEAQPAGNMVVKIHLPKPAAAPESRAGRLTRWFRSGAASF